MNRKIAKTNMQDLMQAAPLLWVAPVPGKSLQDLAEVDEQYQLSLSSIEKAAQNEDQQEGDENPREKSRQRLNPGFPQGG
jgi:hypothetical protein